MPTTLLTPQLLERINGLSLVARRVVEGWLHGLHRSPMKGLSIEFAQHREYSPGDDLKHLDWKVIGRSDRYVIKQYQQETNLRAMLIVDCSRSMAFGGSEARAAAPIPGAGAGGGANGKQGASESGSEAGQASASGGQAAPPSHSKFAYARTLAAAMAYLLIHQGDSVGLVLASDGIKAQVEPGARPAQIISICHALESIEPTGGGGGGGSSKGGGLAATLALLAGAKRRRSLMVVISDLFDDTESLLSALGQLHHAGHDVIVFHIMDPHELDFDLGPAGRGVTVLRDMETGAEFDAEPQLIRGLVRAEVARFLEQLDAGCRRHALHLCRCPTDVAVEYALTSYLHYRQQARH